MSFSFRLGLLILFAVLSLFSWSHCDGGPERTECTSIIDIQMSHNGHTFPLSLSHTHTIHVIFLAIPTPHEKGTITNFTFSITTKGKESTTIKIIGGKSKAKV